MMRFKIENIHTAHGLTFELFLEPSDEVDERSLESFKELLESFNRQGRSALYSYKLEHTTNRIVIGLAEQTKQMARVDHTWNSHREDQKFAVLVVEGDKENYQWRPNGPCPHFSCHWCQQDVWGVDRIAIEVYDPSFGKMKLVHVHEACQKQRERQMAAIPFEKATK